MHVAGAKLTQRRKEEILEDCEKVEQLRLGEKTSARVRDRRERRRAAERKAAESGEREQGRASGERWRGERRQKAVREPSESESVMTRSAKARWTGAQDGMPLA